MKNLYKTLTIIFFLTTIFFAGCLVLTLPIYSKYFPLETALYKIKQHQYTDTYKCKEFSIDLVSELDKIDIQSEVRIGNLTPGEPHAWVSVFFEPQTGNFTSNYY